MALELDAVHDNPFQGMGMVPCRIGSDTARREMLLQKHAEECPGCLAHAFLRPVLQYPGLFVLVSIPLCLNCRVFWVDSRWATLASTFEHHPLAETRAAHAEQLRQLAARERHSLP